MNGLSKRMLVTVVNSTTFERLLTRLEVSEARQPGLLRVLTYHRVSDAAGHPGVYPRIMVSPQAFDEQLRYIASRYAVVSIQDVLDARRTHTPLPPDALLVTFDDAYVDFATHAWPILQRHRMPATLFVPTAYPDNPHVVFWWDWLYQAVSGARVASVETPCGALRLDTPAQRERSFGRLRAYVKQLPHQGALNTVQQLCHTLDCPRPSSSVLGWQALRKLADEGVTMGAHTRTHPLMTRIDSLTMWDEVCGSLADLRRMLGSVLPIFAYPGGAYGDDTTDILKQTAVKLAFTTGHGINYIGRTDPLRLRRINVGQNTTLAVLRMRLLRRFA